MTIIASFNKDPDEVLDYTVDWVAWLDDDTITSSSWTVPAGVTQESSNFTSTTATVWVSGGTDGTDYRCTNTVTTTAGRTAQRVIVIRLGER